MLNLIMHILHLLLVGLTHAAPSSDPPWQSLYSRATPLKPTDDPFYVGPPGFESQPPGTILRSRPVPAPITIFNLGALKNKAAFQILYRSTDSEGNPQAAMTTLIIPTTPDYSKILSYQLAYDSSYINCSPSYTLQQGADTSNGTTTSGLESVVIQAALQQGWLVNVPDYEGDKAALASGPQAAHAILDSVRAVLKSASFSNVTSDARYAMLGYSGGGFATAWATELQPSYARELNFVGAAAGGVLANFTNTALIINGTSSAGLAPVGVMGLAQGYRNLSAYVDANLVPATAAKFKAVLQECISEPAADFAGQDIFKYFKNGVRSLQDPVPKSVFQIGGQLGLRDVPSIPLYYYKGSNDEISPVADTDQLYANNCKRGANIYYARDTGNNHASEAVLGLTGALGWVKDRLGGSVPPKGCMMDPTHWSTLSNDSLALLGPVLYAVLDGLLGDPFFFPG